MSANAVLELNILPQKCTVNPKYYVDNILAEPCKMHLLVGDRQGRFHNEKFVKICRIPSSNSHSVENGSTYSHIKIEPGMVPIKFSYYYVKKYGQAIHLIFRQLYIYGLSLEFKLRKQGVLGKVLPQLCVEGTGDFDNFIKNSHMH